MIIAVPVAENTLSLHFGHCEQFLLFHTDQEKNIINTEERIPPPHEPGVLPKWLAGEGVQVIITGGMGMHAQRLFASYGIGVVLGAPAGDPEMVVRNWLDGTLTTGNNPCDH